MVLDSVNQSGNNDKPKDTKGSEKKVEGINGDATATVNE